MRGMCLYLPSGREATWRSWRFRRMITSVNGADVKAFHNEGRRHNHRAELGFNEMAVQRHLRRVSDFLGDPNQNGDCPSTAIIRVPNKLSSRL